MLAEKMLQFKLSSSFLPSTPSAFQQARRRALHRTVLLGRAAIFGHEEDDGLQDSPRAGCPCGEGNGREEPTGQLHTRLDGEVIEEIRDILEWGSGSLRGDHQFKGCGFSGSGFHTRGYFLICLPSRRRLSGCCRLWLGLLRPVHLPDGCHFRLRGRLRNRLKSGFWIWSGGGLENTHLSGVISAVAQVCLLRRGPGPLGFRSGGLVCDGALPDTFWRTLCKGCLRLFPLNTAPVTRGVVAPAATALRLFPGG